MRFLVGCCLVYFFARLLRQALILERAHRRSDFTNVSEIDPKSHTAGSEGHASGTDGQAAFIVPWQENVRRASLDLNRVVVEPAEVRDCQPNAVRLRVFQCREFT